VIAGEKISGQRLPRGCDIVQLLCSANKNEE
jgi:hypothetical protein